MTLRWTASMAASMIPGPPPAHPIREANPPGGMDGGGIHGPQLGANVGEHGKRDDVPDPPVPGCMRFRKEGVLLLKGGATVSTSIVPSGGQGRCILKQVRGYQHLRSPEELARPCVSHLYIS